MRILPERNKTGAAVNQRSRVIIPERIAAMPGDDESVLKNVMRPYHSKFNRTRCKHTDTINVNLGYDFITDMLVLEFELDRTKVDGKWASKKLVIYPAMWAKPRESDTIFISDAQIKSLKLSGACTKNIQLSRLPQHPHQMLDHGIYGRLCGDFANRDRKSQHQRTNNRITQPSGAATPRDSDTHKRIAVPKAFCVLREHLPAKIPKRQSLPF